MDVMRLAYYAKFKIVYYNSCKRRMREKEEKDEKGREKDFHVFSVYLVAVGIRCWCPELCFNSTTEHLA